VENTTDKFFSTQNVPDLPSYRLLMAPSYILSLVFGSPAGRMTPSIAMLERPFSPQTLTRPAAAIHRIETTIAGRSYVIEVARVADNRWRAQIVRIPGVPVALMPFYGETPDQAAAQLSNWLTRAHRHAATTI
jgi:hypothetical protein